LLKGATLIEGSKPTDFPYPEFQPIGFKLNEPTMIDACHTDVHLVLRYHGDHIPELEKSALYTFNGACKDNPPITEEYPRFGTLGPNTSVDLLFMVSPSENTP
jgi:hypothetical protein